MAFATPTVVPHPHSRRVALFKQIGYWVRYLYLLRFSLMLWLFPLVLIWLNSPNRMRSLVSGIVTPSRSIQYLCVAFFLVSASVVALTMARVVVLNGKERFSDECPPLLARLLADDERRHEWLASMASQLNTVIVFAYFLRNGMSEKVDPVSIIGGLAAGVAFALIFWYAVNAFYYLTYDPPAHRKGLPARTLLFPRSWMFLSQQGGNGRHGDVLEAAETRKLFHWMARFLPVAGYRWPPHGAIYEGHYFALVAASGFFALYWMLWPLTAPLPVTVPSYISIGLYIVCGLIVLWIVLTARAGRPGDARRLKLWKLKMTCAILLFQFGIPALYFSFDAERFPILALVLILVISASWALGCIAFFADRYRIPVLTLTLLAVLIPRYAGMYGGFEEHYLSTAKNPVTKELPTPQEILESKLKSDGSSPLVIVTSTGGGIHAAAWTAAVLGNLEERYQAANLGSLHQHILLMSTVSGGSSGLYTYLRELNTNTNGEGPNWRRMRNAAQCSSLEAIGWGLVYYDFPKSFAPLAPYLWQPSSGSGDLLDTPIGKDQTWALRTAFTRNLDDPFCGLDIGSTKAFRWTQFQDAEKTEQDNARKLTLSQFDALGSGIPAFTMNSTTVENGERFLLSNYRLPATVPGLSTAYRARSFLTTFKSPTGAADLPLATAAQMSATFPYVSSAARVPYNIDPDPSSVHFVDGGYYDNDGTASALEFLRYAVSPWNPSGCGNDKSSTAKSPAADCKVRILLLEIRNSGDVGPTPPEDTPDHSGSDAPWNFGDQAVAPLRAFWSAGHESVTSRNRNILAVLQQALGDKLELRQVILADNNARDRARTDPLNWSLTPLQIGEISSSSRALSANYAEAVCWQTHWDALWDKTPQEQAAICGPQAASAIEPHQ